MKHVLCTLAILTMFVAFTESAQSQSTTASQSVTLEVQSVFKLAVSGNPAALIISDGSEGSDLLTSATENSTRYRLVHNAAANARITAHMESALSAGYTLLVNLASTHTSQGNVDISNALAASPALVVSGITRGAEANQVITYTFSANASAGTLTSTTKTVTFTLTNL